MINDFFKFPAIIDVLFLGRARLRHLRLAQQQALRYFIPKVGKERPDSYREKLPLVRKKRV